MLDFAGIRVGFSWQGKLGERRGAVCHLSNQSVDLKIRVLGHLLLYHGFRGLWSEPTMKKKKKKASK